MQTTTMTMLGYDIEVEYEHSTEKDPYGTGDSPTTHYIDICGVYLDGCKQNVIDLFEPYLDRIEDNILSEIS